MLNELHSLEELFHDHASLLRELGDSLLRQRAAIVHWDLKALTTEQKIHNQLIARLRVMDTARISALERFSKRLGIAGRPSVQSLAAALAPGTCRNIEIAFEKLLAVAGAVSELYNENQKYLSHSLEGVEMSLGVLRTAKQKGATYTCNNDSAKINDAQVPSCTFDQSV